MPAVVIACPLWPTPLTHNWADTVRLEPWEGAALETQAQRVDTPDATHCWFGPSTGGWVGVSVEVSVGEGVETASGLEISAR